MADTKNILVVEDEADMARVLEFNLGERGHNVVVADNGREGLARARQLPPDLIMLDLRLPDMTGFDVLRALRASPDTAAVPVLIVSAMGSEESVVEGLDLGAEDYVTKPFRVHELMARVAGVLRRNESTSRRDRTVEAGELRIDLAARSVELAGQNVELTKTEFDLLVHFASRPGRVFTRRQLCSQVLDAQGLVQERTIDAHIRTIRRKMGAHGQVITTVWGIGYKYEDPDESEI